MTLRLALSLSLSLGCSSLLDLDYEYAEGPDVGVPDADGDAADAAADDAVDAAVDDSVPDMAPPDGGAPDSVMMDGGGGCFPPVDGLALEAPSLAYEAVGEPRAFSTQFTIVQVFSVDGRQFVSRRLTDGYEVIELASEGPRPSQTVNEFLDDIELPGTCINDGPLLDLHMQDIARGAFAVGAVSADGADGFLLQHLSPSGECTSQRHTGLAEGFVRTNSTSAMTRRSAPMSTLNSVAFVGGRINADGYGRVFGQDAVEGLHVVLNNDGGETNIDYQRNGRPLALRNPLGTFSAPPVIVPLSASGWAVFYGADETLHVDLVPSSIDAARTNVLAETGDLFGVATSGPAEPMLLVAKHPTRPAMARVQLVNVTTGTLADLTTYDMPVSIDAID
ncbi:MAG: hypothetical protein AAF411_26150, partial [Myxococcota bacterium]